MDITINELGQLTPDSYILLDMRGDGKEADYLLCARTY